MAAAHAEPRFCACTTPKGDVNTLRGQIKPAHPREHRYPHPGAPPFPGPLRHPRTHLSRPSLWVPTGPRAPPPPPTRLEQTPPRGVGEDTAGPFPGPPPRYLSGKWVSLCWGRPCFLRWLEELLAEGMCASIAPGLRAAAATSCRALRRSGGGRGEGMSCCPGRAPTPHPRPPSPPGPRDGRRHPPPTPPRRGEVAPGSPPAAAGRHGCSGAAAGSPRATGLLPSRPRLVPPRSPSGDSLLVVPVLPLPPSPVSEVRASCQAPGRRGKAAGPAVPPPSPAPGCPGYSPGRAGS